MFETTASKQFLTFTLGEEVFGVEVSRVREILDAKKIIRIPRTPYFMHGVIDLRDLVVPVLDLRLKFGMGATVSTVNTCVIVVEVVMGGERVVVGALADSVQEVFDLEADRIEPPPSICCKANIDLLRGMGKQHEGCIMMLDIDRVFSVSAIESVQAKTG